MRGRSARLLMRALGLLVLISLVLAVVGCGGGGGDKDAIALMKKIPQGTDTFQFMDLEAMRTDKDLQDVFGGVTDNVLATFEMFGFSGNGVDFFAQAGEMYAMQGSFDLAKVRSALGQIGFEKSEYEGTEMWETYGSAIVLVDDSCIIGGSSTDAEDSVDAIKGKAKSLYDDADVKDDMGKLPGDSLVVMWVGGSQGIITDEGYAGLEATAVSMSKKDADELQMTVILRFKDSASAGAALNQFKQDIENDPGAEVTNLKVTQDGQYLKATADAPMDESFFQ